MLDDIDFIYHPNQPVDYNKHYQVYNESASSTLEDTKNLKNIKDLEGQLDSQKIQNQNKIVCKTKGIHYSNSILYPYSTAMQIMVNMCTNIHNSSKNVCWLLQHEDVYTTGIGDNTKYSVPFIKANRGGQITYHGKGQRVVYLLINTKRLGTTFDLRQYIFLLEEVIINTLAQFNVNAIRLNGLRGVWISKNNKFAKIAAIGVGITKGVTMHGFALNICPEMSKFETITPCGIIEHKVTSLEQLGLICNDALWEAVDKAIIQNIKLLNFTNKKDIS